MAFHGFDKNAGPSASRSSQVSFPSTHSNPSPPKTNIFGEKSRFPAAQMNRPQQPPQQQRQVSPRGQRYSAPSHSFASQLNEPVRLGYHTNQVRLSPGAAYVTASQSEAKFPSQSFNYHVPGRTRSPPLPSHDAANLEKYHATADHGSISGIYANVHIGNANAETSKSITSLPLSFGSRPYDEAKRPDISPPRGTSQRKSPVQYANSSPQERFNMVDYSDTYDAGADASPMHSYAKQPKRARSPHPPSAVVLGSSSAQLDSPIQYANSSPQERFKMVDYSDIYDAGVDASPMHSFSKQPKRARSPHPPSAVVLGSSSVQLDSEREMQAKARRLARFNVELSQTTENLLDAKRKASENKFNQGSLDKVGADKPAEARGSSNRDNLFEIESLESSPAVIGLCPDMCPESEREERERKGDLDKYERLDGERNQTSKYLAVKKYNRTAEREADLIRPMPVLQKTVDYLLTLLNQPYNEDFLSIYNFLWDRMRAIRMDLRMQHIFNHQAIIMLEQMIRLHIVAMHELCEYNKGEGFSEGFDAHLNIEQMNKTSVELFQLYDDHRKKGISVPTEKEFRGYYALLKLDKHPGYRVEPAELSLDLAKMTPEIRCTSEILFARDVARACRIGNFIAFFRLARKATYLQACLMHAHFAKLRTQALVSLHSSLQNNQGIPVTHVISWLGLEEEDVESLLEYHGFVLKKFEEIYMVKEGPFLNSDMDFPTKRSQLVHIKKSQRIIDDIYSGPTISQITGERKTVSNELDMVDQRADASEADTCGTASNDVIHDYEASTALRVITQSEKLLEVQTLPFLNRETDVKAAEVFLPRDTSLVDQILSNHAQKNEDEQMVESEGDASVEKKILPKPEVNMVGALVPISSSFNNVVNSSVPQMEMDRDLDNEEQLLVLCQKNEVADEKLRLILRKWKQQATKRRETREQRIMLANAALNSLPLGPPIQQSESLPRVADCELNIDHAARERYRKQGKSWSTLNVSELIAPVLYSRNPEARCLCWKLLILVQPSLKESQTNCVTSRWLLSKVMGSSKENDKPIVSLSHLSMWRSWISTHLSPFYNCCLSIIREAVFDNNNLISKDIVTGTSSVMFIVSESIPWEIQRVRLHKVLTSIPSGSNLPLLIVSGDVYNEEIAHPSLTIIRRLGLHDADMRRMHSFSVVFLHGNYPQENSTGFFKDDKLREGLLWLAKHSPLQPTISLMKTREIVLSYLRSSSEVLENGDASDFGPSHFISNFNAALDRLVEEILTAASMNVNHWPGPEIDLLEKPSNERVFVDIFLPSIGWSSPVRIEPLVRAIEGCKLPEFSNDISWLKQGSHMGSKIPDQKLALEECLTSYITQSCQMLNADLAAREARVMVQTGADLELRGSCYYIIPRWPLIFRRIQNWRLMNLTAGACSVAYLLEQHPDRFSAIDYVRRIGDTTPSNPSTMMQDLEKKNDLEGHRPMHSFSTKLSFDEIVGISCNVTLAERPTSLPEPLSSSLVVHEAGDAPNTHNLAEDNDEDPKCSLSGAGGNQNLATPSEVGDRLTMLLERCTRLQDMIDEKLAVYF